MKQRTVVIWLALSLAIVGTATAAPAACPLAIDGLDTMQCSRRMSLGGMTLENGTVVCTKLDDKLGRFGNHLSRYWHARAVAEVGGLAFRSSIFSNATNWAAHLLSEHDALSCHQPKEFRQICGVCKHWRYPHLCQGSWTRIHQRVRSETQAAVRKWIAELSLRVPKWEPGEVVIQDRCAESTLLANGKYGPVAFSVYNNISPRATKVTIVRDPEIR